MWTGGNGKSQKERRANCARRSSRWKLPRPPLRDSTKEMQAAEIASGLPAQNGGSRVRGLRPLRPRDSKEKPSPRSAGRGLTADFFGASPVASALGIHARRDPSVTRSTYHGWL